MDMVKNLSDSYMKKEVPVVEIGSTVRVNVKNTRRRA